MADHHPRVQVAIDAVDAHTIAYAKRETNLPPSNENIALIVIRAIDNYDLGFAQGALAAAVAERDKAIRIQLAADLAAEAARWDGHGGSLRAGLLRAREIVLGVKM